MGITIFYRGVLRDTGDLPQLTALLQLACARLAWPCRRVDERILGMGERIESSEIATDDGIPTHTFAVNAVPVDDHVRGVAIAPPGCETLHLTFGRTGRLIEYCAAPFGDPTPGRYGLTHEHLFTKTQFSSPEIHMQVCELLRIVEPFMAEWVVSDDGGYWGLWDEAALRDVWTRHTAILDALSDPALLQEILEAAGVDTEVTQPPEAGKQITVAHPLWRQAWGISAGDN